MKKRIIPFLLIMVILFGMLPVTAFAEVADEPVQMSVTCVNPVYADVIDVEDLEFFHQKNELLYSSPEGKSGTTYYTEPEEVAPILREAMTARTGEITVPYVVYEEDLATQEAFSAFGQTLIDAALEHTGVPDEGDYLRWHASHWQIGLQGYWNEDKTAINADLTFHMFYYTDAAQEAAVTARVDELLAELNPTGTDYEKLKTVYDWMCDNIDYDYANLSDDSHTLKYSAYAALINGTSVCQGYANLLYRLALEMGIDCRMITGVSNGQNHAWNIAKMGNRYYNLDATWDADAYAQTHFLRSDANFSNHDRNDAYATESFYAAYPMGESDYEPEKDEPQYVASGTCDEFLTWTLDAEGTLTISGTGLMGDFDRQDTAPWYEHREAVKKVVIQDGVTSIGALAFCDCVNLANVEIADTVTEIGLGAFWDCDSLLSIVIPDSVTTMEECLHDKLQSVTLSNSLTMIDQGMFANCTDLTSIVIPEGVTSLEKGVFFGCENLGSVILPSTLTKIGHEVFYGCTSLKAITIPETVTEIGGCAFQNSGLISVSISKNVTEIWEHAFDGCVDLMGISVDQENPVYSSDASGALLDKSQKTLIQVPGGLTGKYEIPDGVTSIEGWALSFCRKLTEVTIPDSVDTIGDGAFYGCAELKSVIIPAGISMIDEAMFSGCANLTAVVIPDTVTEIADWAFEDCDNIWHVLYTGTEDQWNAVTIGKNNTTVKKATCHYNAVGDEVITAGRTTCTKKISCECTICGAVLAETIEGGTHTWDDGVVTKEPTEETTGVRTYTCSVCGTTRTEEIPVLEHSHNYESVVTAPTCTEKGYTTYTCTCGDSYEDDYVDALDHTWDDGVVTTEPTEETTGVRTYTCSVCGTTRTEEIPALEHTHDFIATVVAPTCTETGYTIHVCSCGEEVLTDVTDPLGHKIACAVSSAPTVDAEGALHVTCVNCDKDETVTLPKLNKTDYSYEVTQEPTTEEAGTAVYTWNVTDYGVHHFKVTLDKLSAPSEIVYGDVDGNGRIQTNDAKLILQYIVKIVDNLDKNVADVDGNGRIQTNDAKLILQYIVKIISEFPAAANK